MRWRSLTSLAGALVLVAAAVRVVSSLGAAPNVLLITIDTLRADHLGCYGQSLPTSPMIDAFATRSVLFERAVAASGYTGPAHVSIMTSRYPRRQSMGLSNGRLKQAGVETLADSFRRAGYDTAAFVSNAVVSADSGLNQGFDVYDDALPSVEPNRPVFQRLAPQTVDRVRSWLEQPRDKPFFLWVHFQDPHGPYTPPLPYRDQFQRRAAADEPELPVLADNGGRGGIPPYQVVAGGRRVSDYESRYAGEVAYVDDSVGQLLSSVERRGPTIVALLADHGESFGESGFYFAHGHSAAPDLSHVPLILSAPGLRPERRADLVSQVDVMPTLLQLAGVPTPGGVDGIALGPILHERAAVPPRAVFCDVGYEVGVYGPPGFLLAATAEDRTWALEEFYQSGGAARARAIAGLDRLIVRQTFHWSGGPTWSATEPDTHLAAQLASYLAASSAPGVTRPLRPADRERLRSLGYGAP